MITEITTTTGRAGEVVSGAAAEAFIEVAGAAVVSTVHVHLFQLYVQSTGACMILINCITCSVGLALYSTGQYCTCSHCIVDYN